MGPVGYIILLHVHMLLLV